MSKLYVAFHSLMETWNASTISLTLYILNWMSWISTEVNSSILLMDSASSCSFFFFPPYTFSSRSWRIKVDEATNSTVFFLKKKKKPFFLLRFICFPRLRLHILVLLLLPTLMISTWHFKIILPENTSIKNLIF